MKTDIGGRVIVTGARGWLGTEFLESVLMDRGSEFVNSNIVCLGSAPSFKTLSDGTILPITKLSDAQIQGSVDGILHLAFLTRGRVTEMPAAEYVNANLSITSNILKLIKTHRPNWVATVSSGAVLDSSTGELETDLIKNPYGFTKRIEESLLAEACETAGSNLAIGRLWGAMGLHMPINREYAVSDFIVQALESNFIQVHARHEVFRRYCSANEFLDVLLHCATTNPFTCFDSGGELVELGVLAEKIATRLMVQSGARTLDNSGYQDRYYPNSRKYEELAADCGVTISGLDSTLEETLIGHAALGTFE